MGSHRGYYSETHRPALGGALVLRRPHHSSSPAWAEEALAVGAPPPYLRPERHDAGQEPDEDVCVHAPLVGLVDDHDLVLGQQEVLGVEANG